MNGCAYLWLTRTQARLAQALATESKHFGAEFVRKSQAAWVTYRDADCRLQTSSYQGGSIYNLIYYTCEATLTDLRTKQVQTDIANLPH